jgi:hypothetical protein
MATGAGGVISEGGRKRSSHKMRTCRTSERKRYRRKRDFFMVMDAEKVSVSLTPPWG